MEIKINSKKENKLLERTDIYFSAEYEGTKSPGRAELRKNLAEKLSADEKLLILDNFEQKAGKSSGNGYAKLYINKEAMEKIERNHINNRNFPKKTEKKE